MDSRNNFYTALDFLPQRQKNVLSRLPSNIISQIYEIRLRAGLPLALSTPDDTIFACASGRVSRNICGDMLYATVDDIDYVFNKACMHSVYSHQSEIADGYVITPKGHRIGICGTAVINDGKVSNIKDISSLNIRIAKEIKTAAKQLIPIFASCLGGLLIAGAPACGKTTALRDLVRRISLGEAGGSRKVTVIDERCEIAAVYGSMPQYDVGPNTDVISGINKADGIMMALRSMSPDVIVFDEIGKAEEISALRQSLNAGVRAITTIHSGSIQQLLMRPQMQQIIESGAFSKAVQLSGRGETVHIEEVYDLEEAYAKAYRSSCNYIVYDGSRGNVCQRA
ncbi:MAG TPA: Flp pilus assembly complex ATPase component TadA [Firmicutes bacterium]|nr:Flp pilus assembly complex ATPase component TadA [Bacillota bacterium]